MSDISVVSFSKKRGNHNMYISKYNKHLNILSAMQNLLFIILDQPEKKSNVPKVNSIQGRVSVQGVESLWGDCRFIPADWGS